MSRYLIILLGTLLSCNSRAQLANSTRDHAIFEAQRIVATLENNLLKEASGLEESYKNPGHLWSHNDSGGQPKLYLINLNAEVVLEVMLEGVSNRDWEEVVTVREGNKSFIYVAEMGDNKAVHDELQIIKLEEPKLEEVKNVSVPYAQLEIMKFGYEEGARDAEALMYDYAKDELVLVTKREENAMVYSFPFQSDDDLIKVKSLGTVPSRLFTAADSRENGEILLKHYDSIFYWSPSKEPIAKRLLEWKGNSIPYEPEPQGEAMCWLGEDFYTLSEKAVRDQKLLVFKRR